MSKHKYTNIVSIIIICLSLIVTILFMNGEALGISNYSTSLSYETQLFDDSFVHTVDIVIDQDDWDDMLENAGEKEYINSTIVIDNEIFNNVAIRTKGNSSLDNILRTNSDRFSFKIEFDHFDNTLSYFGLDKISLNNIYQDNTYLKDYLAYDMLNSMGVPGPLASYVYITVNGEDWGLYLAVEAVEDSFIDRVYGKDSDGNLYKPETTEDMMPQQQMGMTEINNGEIPNFDAVQGNDGEQPTSVVDSGNNQDISVEGTDTNGSRPPIRPDMNNNDSENMDNMDNMQEFGGMNSSNTSANGATLEYTDDDYSSYSDIFDNAKTDVSASDKDTLIEALKQLSTGENIASAIDVDSVIDYFVVHNYLLNFDSYTGTMLHNYYLYEEDGLLSMIGWDYNLSFGTFTYEANETATTYVNFPIDTPTVGNVQEQRPMLDKLLTNEEYLNQYHDKFLKFIDLYFENGYFEETIDNVADMIDPYVKKDPTAFCTYEEFLQGVKTLKEFCLLRTESIQGQLDGTIPSTITKQVDSAELINADYLEMSDLGQK